MVAEGRRLVPSERQNKSPHDLREQQIRHLTHGTMRFAT